MQGNLQQRGPSSWRIRVFLGRDDTGKKRYIERTVRGTKREAQRVMAHLVVEVDEGRHVAAAATTFGAVLERWLEVKSGRPRREPPHAPAASPARRARARQGQLMPAGVDNRAWDATRRSSSSRSSFSDTRLGRRPVARGAGMAPANQVRSTGARMADRHRDQRDRLPVGGSHRSRRRARHAVEPAGHEAAQLLRDLPDCGLKRGLDRGCPAAGCRRSLPCLVGADLFVEHASARPLGVTRLAVGLLLAAAEPGELVTAVIAAARD